MLPLLALLAFSTLAPRIHSISDISQEFTFYMDGRFHRQYIGDAGVDARNWGTLWKLDLKDTNLLVLSGGDHRVPYHDRSVEHVVRFVREGGGLLLMADAPPEGEAPLTKVSKAFGASFSGVRAEGQPFGVGSPGGQAIELRKGGTLEIAAPWQPIVKDASGRVLMARRAFGKGNVLMSVRGLFGSNPDASDAINRDWIAPLLREIAAGKEVDEARPPKDQFAELSRQIGPLTLEYTEGTLPFASAIAKEYEVVRGHLEEITGVKPSPGMITKLLLLPTGGGGFSSGERIGIAAWWGDYPKNRYPMIELIGHEAGHSWVLPHPEPVWNEPIATYLGIQVGKRMGMPEAQRTLDDQIERGRKHDPNMDKVDIGKPGAPRDAVWGKTYWIFEQLEKTHGPGVIGKYFQAKRRLVPAGRPGYSLDDSVAVLSAGVGTDLFPWFRSLGIDVDRSRTSIGRDAGTTL
ncbi:MAG TPA: hypothetical protein VGE01_14745 [Fimbriimonas sp.]